jgi:hypothetical protein
MSACRQRNRILSSLNTPYLPEAPFNSKDSDFYGICCTVEPDIFIHSFSSYPLSPYIWGWVVWWYGIPSSSNMLSAFHARISKICSPRLYRSPRDFRGSHTSKVTPGFTSAPDHLAVNHNWDDPIACLIFKLGPSCSSLPVWTLWVGRHLWPTLCTVV